MHSVTARGGARWVARWLPLGIALTVLGGATGCHKSDATSTPSTVTAPARPQAPAWLEDVTEKVGLNFVHDVGPLGTYFMPESVGSGVGVFDFDGDGRMDIFLLQNAGTNSSSRHKLFHQESEGHFLDVSAGSGLDLQGRGMGVAIGDGHNDGKPDVRIPEYDRARLFRNLGDRKLREVTSEA